MKTLPILFTSLCCILLWSFTPIPNNLNSSFFCELIDVGQDVEISLGETYDLELNYACPLTDIASIVWEPTTYLDCDPAEFCLGGTILPLADICYEVTVTSMDGTVGVDNICIFIEGCDSPFSVNNISSITPTQIDDNAEIALDMVRQQYTRIDLVDGTEVLFEIWEGWVGSGERTIDLDFSAIPAGDYQLRVDLYPDDLLINIQKN